MARPSFYEDKKYKLATINGEQHKMYGIGVLAKRLRRQSVTIRIWEKEGIIPKSEFRDKHGRRLYTQEQVEAIHYWAMKDRVARGRSFALTNFSVHCHRHFAELHKKYFGGKENAKNQKENSK